MKKENLELDMECSDLEFTVEPFAYDEEDKNFYCTLKLVVGADSEKTIELLKLYDNVASIKAGKYIEDENGEAIYLTDYYNLKLNFLEFREDE